ncbi:MAG: hypothetical protein HY538_08360 [Deltaproteobacteria bacterium]|nr:hypothetical protein [Deltaproteobacteria bacterium]
MYRRWLLLFFILEFGCASTLKYADQVPEENLLENVHTIALAPMFVPSDYSVPELNRQKFQALIEQRLTEAGFKIIPSNEYSQLWKKYEKQIGPFFDPMTGKRDETKVEAVRQKSLQEMKKNFGIDVILYNILQVVPVEYNQAEARWDGAKQYIGAKEGFWGQLNNLSTFGSVHAFSLVIQVKDLGGNDLYVGRGGVQPLSKISGSSFVDMSPEELLADEKKNIQAINLALDPLLQK